ncbi:hypothetical protein [Pseudomonas sp. R5(2019)]|uniref:hypothetical protein n=1 Tax=Pseudomonas sp. R5(2019) TaxID=2697566 RepID=UPI0014127296|nr:hypothetical protein [Pseudomonas sp. R5(2019)]NBA93663.1 hypothetical protein [Pseudomonas sp. R5(2019)]
MNDDHQPSPSPAPVVQRETRAIKPLDGFLHTHPNVQGTRVIFRVGNIHYYPQYRVRINGVEYSGINVAPHETSVTITAQRLGDDANVLLIGVLSSGVSEPVFSQGEIRIKPANTRLHVVQNVSGSRITFNPGSARFYKGYRAVINGNAQPDISGFEGANFITLTNDRLTDQDRIDVFAERWSGGEERVFPVPDTPITRPSGGLLHCQQTAAGAHSKVTFIEGDTRFFQRYRALINGTWHDNRIAAMNTVDIVYGALASGDVIKLYGIDANERLELIFVQEQVDTSFAAAIPTLRSSSTLNSFRISFPSAHRTDLKAYRVTVYPTYISSSDAIVPGPSLPSVFIPPGTGTTGAITYQAVLPPLAGHRPYRSILRVVGVSFSEVESRPASETWAGPAM